MCRWSSKFLLPVQVKDGQHCQVLFKMEALVVCSTCLTLDAKPATIKSCEALELSQKGQSQFSRTYQSKLRLVPLLKILLHAIYLGYIWILRHYKVQEIALFKREFQTSAHFDWKQESTLNRGCLFNNQISSLWSCSSFIGREMKGLEK